MIFPDDLERLLTSDESDVIERKASLADEDGIRKSIITFANDLANRGGGRIVIGQQPDKTVIGLKVAADEAQQTISNLARNRCFPAISVVIDICDYKGRSVAVVDVKTSPARPHFHGACYVRQGSTNRIATDAEIMVLRSANANPKLAQLLRWVQEGKTKITADQVPTGMWGRAQVELIEVTDNYVALRYNPSTTITVSLNDLELGYDHQNKRPLIKFRREG
jgi:Putative DNA-binding domain